MRALFGLICLMLPLGAGADEATMMAFVKREACAVGPPSLPRAAIAGIDGARLIAFAQSAVAAGQAEKEGRWIVWDAAHCTIPMPAFAPALRPDDPEVIAGIFRPDKLFNPWDAGCFISRNVSKARARREGWSEEQEFDAYMQFLGAGLTEGWLHFYSPSPLSTPASFQTTLGAGCQDAPHAAELTRSHAYRTAQFDRLLRAGGAASVCGKDRGLNLMTVLPEVWGFETAHSNAWLAFEVELIAMAAGWFEGSGARERGKPRPPLCHYE